MVFCGSGRVDSCYSFVVSDTVDDAMDPEHWSLCVSWCQHQFWTMKNMNPSLDPSDQGLNQGFNWDSTMISGCVLSKGPGIQRWFQVAFSPKDRMKGPGDCDLAGMMSIGITIPQSFVFFDELLPSGIVSHSYWTSALEHLIGRIHYKWPCNRCNKLPEGIASAYEWNSDGIPMKSYEFPRSLKWSQFPISPRLHRTTGK